MKSYLVSVFSVVLLFAGCMSIDANAQTSATSAQAHLAAAKAVANRPGFNFSQEFEVMCAEPKAPAAPASAASTAPATRKIPPRSQWYAEPRKVFDNLYYVGSSNENNQAIWAVTTSDGIVLIDTGYEYSVAELVTNGLKKLGQDPARLKYVILAHAHAHSFFGSTYLQKTYPQARFIMSEADWNVLAKSTEPAELKPKKDMVATDGMKLTLGDTTLTLYITPGHTPGTISTLVPLKDGNQRHLGYVLGGRGWTEEEAGVRYFPNEQTALKTWIASIKRFQGIAAKAGADVFLAIHPQHDHLFEKMDALQLRRSRDPNAAHPFVSKEAIQNHATVMTECMEAQLAWLAAGKSD